MKQEECKELWLILQLFLNAQERNKEIMCLRTTAPRAASRGERTSPTRLYTLGARKFFKIIVDRWRRYAYNKPMNTYSYEHSNGMCNNLIEPENNERRELRKNIRKEAA